MLVLCDGDAVIVCRWPTSLTDVALHVILAASSGSWSLTKMLVRENQQ